MTAARIRRAVAAAVAACLLAACATPPPPPQPRTTVTLLPDEDGQVGAVLVSNAAGTQRVSEAFAATTAPGPAATATAPPTTAVPLGQAAVDAVNEAYTFLKAR